MTKKQKIKNRWFKTIAEGYFFMAILLFFIGCADKSYIQTQTQQEEIQMKFETLTISDLSIRYAHDGTPDGQTIVLLSPLPQSILAYHNIWDELALHFNVYAVDLPGFGRSEGGIDVMDAFVQAKLLEKIIDRLNIQSPHIIGPDVGSPVSFAYLTISDNVSSIMVGDGPSVYPPYMGKTIERIMHSSFWRWVYSRSSTLFVKAGARVCYKRYHPTKWETQDYLASYKGRMNAVMAWFATYDQVLPKIDASLEKVDIPVKIFWGDKDVIVLPETAEKLHAKLKRSELQIFKNTGHYSYQDAAEEFSKMVIDWVNGGFREI